MVKWANLSNLSESFRDNPILGLLAPLVIPKGWRYNLIESTAAQQLLAFFIFSPSLKQSLAWPGLLAPLVIPEGWRYNRIESTAAQQLLAFLFLVLRSSGAWLGL